MKSTREKKKRRRKKPEPRKLGCRQKPQHGGRERSRLPNCRRLPRVAREGLVQSPGALGFARERTSDGVQKKCPLVPSRSGRGEGRMERALPVALLFRTRIREPATHLRRKGSRRQRARNPCAMANHLMLPEQNWTSEVESYLVVFGLVPVACRSRRALSDGQRKSREQTVQSRRAPSPGTRKKSHGATEAILTPRSPREPRAGRIEQPNLCRPSAFSSPRSLAVLPVLRSTAVGKREKESVTKNPL